MYLPPLAPTTFVLIHTDVSVEEIAGHGKAFNWKRPSCPCGSGKVWGHGYVSRCIATVAAPLWLRRYRCPQCRKVLTMMPSGFERRYQTAAAAIGRAIESRLSHRGWPQEVPRQRGGHWLREFLAACRMDNPSKEPLDVLRHILAHGLPLLV